VEQILLDPKNPAGDFDLGESSNPRPASVSGSCDPESQALQRRSIVQVQPGCL